MSEIEKSKASAIAAFRAGRAAGFREAIMILADLIGESGTHSEMRILFDACEKVRAAAAHKEGDE